MLKRFALLFCSRTFAAALLLLGWGALRAESLTIGFAAGFPPYQWSDATGPKGLDIDLARLVFAEAGLAYTLRQEKWDDIVGHLRFDEEIQVVGGMEITPERLASFAFSTPLYARVNRVFVRADDDGIRQLGDLAGKVVTGDRNSFIEGALAAAGLKPLVRIIQTPTKAEAMKRLKAGAVRAALMPEHVGLFLARQEKLAVRSIDAGDPGTPVAFAVRKGREGVIETLDAAIVSLAKKGRIQATLAAWGH